MLKALYEKLRTFLLDQMTVRMLEVVTVTKNLSVLLEAGVPIAEAVSVLIEQTTGRLRTTLLVIEEDLNGGVHLADALRAHPKVFPFLLVSAVEIGEQSGTLSRNLTNVAEQMTKDLKIKQDIMGALLYPMIILCASILLMFGLATFVLPQLVGVFSSLGTKLPMSTRILIWISNVFQKYGMIITPGFFIGLLALIAFFKRKFMRPFTHNMLLRLPFLGSFFLDFNRARACRSIGTMLESGVPIKEALDLTSRTVSNVLFQKSLHIMMEQIETGETVAEILKTYPFLFPSMMQHMVAVGEKSGGLGKMFLYLATYFEERVSVKAKTFSSVLEPILLLAMGLVVGFLAVAIFTPIYSISSALSVT